MPEESVVLTCEAITSIGDGTVTYSWYQLTTNFSTPPNEVSDLIQGETGSLSLLVSLSVSLLFYLLIRVTYSITFNNVTVNKGLWGLYKLS